MKDDIGELPPVPKKRRALEQALDLHLAMWLAREDLTPSERRRVQDEKDRRKALTRTEKLVVMVPREGLTPPQREAVRGALGRPTAMVTLRPSDNYKDEMKDADRVLAAPKEMSEPIRKDNGVWAAIKYAKHRKLPVRVVMPDGTIQGESDGR